MVLKQSAAIDPGKSIAYRHKQSKFTQLDGVLPLRWIAAGPSGAGKGVTMQNLILKHFRGCWERIYVFSPTAILDKSTWDPIRRHIQEDLGVDLKKEPAFFTDFDPAVLEGIVKKHSDVVQKQKDRGDRKLFGALVIVDDFGDDATVLHKGGG
jgi:hypothetical protein